MFASDLVPRLLYGLRDGNFTTRLRLLKLVMDSDFQTEKISMTGVGHRRAIVIGHHRQGCVHSVYQYSSPSRP
jgi:hypothetical protein